MSREYPSRDEQVGHTDDEQSELAEREVVDASAWTDQRATDESGVVRRPDAEPAPSASMAVLDALADWYGARKLDIHPPLYESIDPESLDRFLASSDGQVEFRHRDATVTVDHQQNVSIASAQGE
ncbi:HalOD1 output domain-containing protein [Halomicroarcula sp. GCM10025324]|uniref:HalOD1 output domain-containing protein n=1 Tax=Haloarcula TaxID=2237 RepID=UPI0023E83DA5|nr:HalOD1 output domain-containing protein [Halomicroarcula sp. ZS-22-S1]